MGAIHGWDVDAAVVRLVVAASVLLSAYLPLKIATRCQVFVSELSKPADLAAIAASPIALCFIGAQVHKRIHAGLGSCVVATASVLQVLCMARFLRLVAKSRAKPEPFWFPPTVSFAMTAMQAKACGWHPMIHQGCFFAAVAVMLGILPFASYRVARHPSTVAVSPACFILCAPASLTSLAWHLVGRPPWPGQLAGPSLGRLLFAASSLFFAQALLSLWLRRKHWASAPFSPAWAAFTFPLASTTSAALCAHEAFFPGNLAFAAYTWLLFVVCNVVILGTTLLYVSRLPSWLRGEAGATEVPGGGSARSGEEERARELV